MSSFFSPILMCFRAFYISPDISHRNNRKVHSSAGSIKKHGNCNQSGIDTESILNSKESILFHNLFGRELKKTTNQFSIPISVRPCVKGWSLWAARPHLCRFARRWRASETVRLFLYWSSFFFILHKLLRFARPWHFKIVCLFCRFRIKAWLG